MRSIAWACPVVIFFCLCQGIMSRKPKMTPAQDELVIQEGNELTIQCEGAGRLQFSKQTNSAEINGSEFKTYEGESPGTYKFVSNGTKKEDTGWYACAEEGVEIWNDETNLDHESNDIAWIYVYVNSTEPFVIDAFMDLLTAVAGDTLVVPCRTTSPDIASSVKPQLNWGMTDLPENRRYDPKIGFILSDVGKVLSTQNFECQVDGSESEPVSYTLNVIDSVPLKHPKINLTKIHHVMRGRNLTVDCEIDVPTETKGFNMSWTVPESVPKERWSIKGPIVVSHSTQHRTSKIELTIQKFEASYDGLYRCEASAGQERVQSWEEIRSLDPYKYFIRGEVEGPNSITANKTEPAIWKIEIYSYPDELEWKWYKPNGHEIITNRVDKNSRYSYSNEGIYHFFRISETNVEDNGNYTIELKTEKNKTTINLQLTVRAAPLVRMDEASPYYLPGKSATFTCHALGSPLPNVTWLIREYPDLTSKENPHLKYPVNVSNKLGEKDSYLVISTLDVRINTTADVTCRSCNEIDCVNSTRQILVSDVSGHFAIIDPGLVAEGDDINITCAATGYNFTDTITWSLEDPKKQEFNKSRIDLTQRRSDFTSQSILRVRDVKKTDEGKYVCRAVNKQGSTETLGYQLIVHAAVAPHFNNNSMEESNIVIDNHKNGTERSMTMMCFAEGMPIPQLTWYKNGQLLVESNQYTFSKNNSTLKIAFFHDGDSGRYVCKATNRIGTAERHVDIQIAGNSKMFLIGGILAFVVIVIIVITYMGIRLHREKVFRRKLMDVVSIDLQEEMVDQTDLLSYDKRMDFLQDQLNSPR